jgi:hypothetical protein
MPAPISSDAALVRAGVEAPVTVGLRVELGTAGPTEPGVAGAGMAGRGVWPGAEGAAGPEAELDGGALVLATAGPRVMPRESGSRVAPGVPGAGGGVPGAGGGV